MESFCIGYGTACKNNGFGREYDSIVWCTGIEIVETGLRPGEKLYEELLVKTEELDKTSNSMIFIERDSALSPEEINTRLNMLREVCETGDDSQAREVLRKAVPTFKSRKKLIELLNLLYIKKSEPEREEAVAI